MGEIGIFGIILMVASIVSIIIKEKRK